MLSRTPLLAASAVVLALGTGCPKKSGPVAPDAPAAASDPAALPPPPAADANVEKVQIRGSISNISDMFKALHQLQMSYVPDQASDPMADLQASLLQSGFGPSFLDNIDLGGTHVFSVGYAAQETTNAADADVAGNIAVKNARKVIESAPSMYRPQPMGDGVWEFKQDSVRVLLKESGKELHFGLSKEDLDAAGKLRSEIASDRRIKARGWNIPKTNLDPTALLDLPRDSQLVKAAGKLLQEVKAIDFETDFGTKQDLEMVVKAEAPFHLLGLEPLGEARQAATALEYRLPNGAMFIASMSWGDPALVHKLIDSNINTEAIPAPFGGIVKKALSGAHALLDQLANDVVLAVYLNKRGEAAILLAADVKDEAKTVAGLRSINEAIVKAVESQQALVGKNKDAKIGIDWKPDGLGFAGGKADKLVLTVPKDRRDDAAKAKIFLKRGKFESVSFVRHKTAILVMGAAGRKIAADVARTIGKKRKDSLAQNEGLVSLRKSMGGCQICVAGDPLAYFKFRLLLTRDGTQDKDIQKEAKALLASVGKIKTLGEPGAGVRLAKDNGSVGVVVPEAAVFAPRKSIEQLQGVVRFVDGDTASVAAPEPPKRTVPKKDKKKGKGKAKPKKE